MDYLLSYLGSCLISTIIIVCIGESVSKPKPDPQNRIKKEEPITLESIIGIFFFSALVTPIGAVFMFVLDLKGKKERDANDQSY